MCMYVEGKRIGLPDIGRNSERSEKSRWKKEVKSMIREAFERDVQEEER